MTGKSKKTKKNRDFSSQLYKEIEKIQKKFDISDEELIGLISKKRFSKEKIPVCIFSTRKLSSFEAIVKYLRENCNLNFREIGELLNRSQFTIASSYRSSKSKLAKKFVIKSSEFDIPTKRIADRKLSVLESIAHYLKQNFRLKFSDIARILNLNQKTIWTVYHRAQKKRKHASK